MRKAAILSYFLFLLLSATAQQHDISGYIVTLKGDTDRVSFRDVTEEKFRSGVQVFRNGAYQALGLEDITGFGVPDKFHFRIVSFVNPLKEMRTETHFAKLLFDGTQKLLSFMENDNLFFVYQNKDTSCLIFNDQKQNMGELIAPANYKNQLYFFGRNCESVSREVERLSYGENALTMFVSAVEKCQGTFAARQVMYRKEKAVSEWNVFAGGMALAQKTDLLLQITQRKSFSAKSRNTSFNYGVVVSHNTMFVNNISFFNGEERYKQTTFIVMVPVYIQYNMTSGAVQPFIYGGLGLAYKRQTEIINQLRGYIAEKGRFGAGFMLGFGLECRLSKNLWAKADYRYDILFHLPVVGLMYKF